MSYMGVKQHCISMEKEGYLKAWRKPKEGKVGRPEIAYLITPKANELFPQEAHQMTLDILKEAEKLFGHAAADKLLYSYYEMRLRAYQTRIKGIDFQTRAASFVKIRNDEGFMSSFLPGNPPQILEYHSPILLVQKKYPLIARLESEMVGKLLDTPAQRIEREVAGQYQAVYAFGDIQSSEPSTPEPPLPEPAVGIAVEPAEMDQPADEAAEAEAVSSTPEPPFEEETAEDRIIELDEEFLAADDGELSDEPAAEATPPEDDAVLPDPPEIEHPAPPAKEETTEEKRPIQTSFF